MRNIFSLVLSLLISTNVIAEDLSDIASTIQDDVSLHAADIIQGRATNPSSTAKRLSFRLKELKKVISNKQLKREIISLESTIEETKVIIALRKSLTKELKSKPSPEELMKTYFELKASGQV